MTFWIDEQISPKFAVWLAQRFQVICHSVDTLGYFNTPDVEIFEKARAEKVIVITKDRLPRNGTDERCATTGGVGDMRQHLNGETPSDF